MRKVFFLVSSAVHLLFFPALQNSPCDPCCVHCFLHQCALCQEHREMKHRLTLDDAPLNLAPPTEQEMTPDIKHTHQAPQ